MGSKHSFCGPTVFHVGVGGGDKEMAKWLLLLILCNSEVFLERKQCHVAVTKMRLGNVTNLMSKLGFKQNQASTENRLSRGLLIHKMSYCQ